AANAPTATDNCTATVTEGATTTIAGNCTGNYTLVVAYTVEDACGNTNPTTAELRINVTDTNAPTFTASPSDLTMECNGSGNTAGLNAWLSSNGTTGAASDDCGTVSWSYQLAGSVVGACNGTGSWTYWFIATDDCGNISSESATVTIEDTTDPVVTCPADVTVQCGDATDPSATGTATATDVCNPNGVTVTYSDVLVTGCTST